MNNKTVSSAVTDSDSPVQWHEQYTSHQGFDEMLCTDGIKKNWQVFLRSLNKLNLKELQKVRIDTQRYLRENGVIYNVQADTQALAQIWELDPLPILFSSSSWATFEQGIQQRAQLFNAILIDIYGPQHLIKQGIIPSDVIFSHSGFLRPAVNAMSHTVMLPLYACDYAFDQEGNAQIIRDLSQAPSGAGHALENRLLMSNMWPEVFRELNTKRIASFFTNFKSMLTSLSPRLVESPEVVVLTTGPDSETYFEQAYLASYLGYHLVQGNDLTVQDGSVWLKSINGLERVDVILRHLNDTGCDPVELDASGLYGVPGLLQAVRQKNVAIANPIGSGVIENPGLYPFLNQICQYLYKEDLLLPTVSTWWCGQEKEKQHVIDNIENLIIKSIDKHRPTIDGQQLDNEQRDKLIKDINLQPYKFVGQARIELSTAPVFTKDRLIACTMSMRVFTTMTAEQEVLVLPGGIANTVQQADGEELPTRISKDIWVQSSENNVRDDIVVTKLKKAFNLRRIRELESILPSSAAESLYWTGRYTERSETSARLLRCVINELNDYYQHGEQDTKRYLTLLTDSLQIPINAFLDIGVQNKKEFQIKSALGELRSSLCDESQNGALVQLLAQFSSSAFSVRDLWSGDTWRTIDLINEARKNLHNLPINRFTWQENLDDIISLLMSFVGVVSESMMHENSWRMVEIGRKIERLNTLIKTLSFFFGNQQDDTTESLLSEASLTINESLINHRRRYRRTPDPETTLELLITEYRNPRSMMYQIDSLRRHIDKLPHADRRIPTSDLQKLALSCDTDVKLIDIDNICLVKEGVRENLQVILKGIYNNVEKISETLAHNYFTHTQISHQLTDQDSSIIKLV